MIRVCHISPQLDQDRLHCEMTLPLREAGEFRWVDFAVAWVDTWEVDLGDELDFWWCVWVVWAAVETEGVDAVFVR